MKKRKSKATANRLLTKYLDQVSKEETELFDDPDSGVRMASKAEAMARLMFKMALGYKEVVENDVIVQGKKTGVVETDITHKPDKGMIALIYDRLEGRATTAEDATKRKSTIADKVSNEGVKRIAQAGKSSKK
jgi:hypothetical protein